jgi:hypothetical protein
LDTAGEVIGGWTSSVAGRAIIGHQSGEGGVTGLGGRDTGEPLAEAQEVQSDRRQQMG